jgi:hypothetical protein
MTTAHILESTTLEGSDAQAMAIIDAKIACRETLRSQAERVAHYVRRIGERGDHPGDVVIVVLAIDDPNGGSLASTLTPGRAPEWLAMRRRGEKPVTSALTVRASIARLLEMADADAAAKLENLRDVAAVVVLDHGVAEVFEPREAA